MTSRATMTELEWLGWEVLAARALHIGSASAAVLRCIVQHAPETVTYGQLAEGVAAIPRVAAHGPRTSVKAWKVHVSWIRVGLSEAGYSALADAITSTWGVGYWMQAEEAEWIADLVLGLKQRAEAA